jgi:hypothetical protein
MRRAESPSINEEPGSVSFRRLSKLGVRPGLRSRLSNGAAGS